VLNFVIYIVRDIVRNTVRNSDFIVSMPRTATTILHRALATDTLR